MLEASAVMLMRSAGQLATCVIISCSAGGVLTDPWRSYDLSSRNDASFLFHRHSRSCADACAVSQRRLRELARVLISKATLESVLFYHQYRELHGYHRCAASKSTVIEVPVIAMAADYWFIYSCSASQNLV